METKEESRNLQTARQIELKILVLEDNVLRSKILL